MDNEKEIQEISIPEGFEATIDGNKIILKKIESEDERVRKELLAWLQNTEGQVLPMDRYNAALAWLEKQGQKPRKVSIWKHWKDGICGNGEGKLIYLIKNGDAYSLSSSLGFECDYILLSDLDNLMLENQGQPRMQNGIIINGVEYELIEDKEADECVRCALREKCHYSNEVICTQIFENLYAHHRLEKR